MNEKLKNLTNEKLIDYIEDLSKNWLAHDGLWFQEVEKEFGIKKAIELDANAWKIFSSIEAKRIMNRFDIPKNGGIAALVEALNYRLYSNINIQETIEITENRCVFRMNDCRVQSARKRKNLLDFPCKTVGLVEYEVFAQNIDPRIKTRCISCPPDPHPDNYYCAWEFIIE